MKKLFFVTLLVICFFDFGIGQDSYRISSDREDDGYVCLVSACETKKGVFREFMMMVGNRTKYMNEHTLYQNCIEEAIDLMPELTKFEKFSVLDSIHLFGEFYDLVEHYGYTNFYSYIVEQAQDYRNLSWRMMSCQVRYEQCKKTHPGYIFNSKVDEFRVKVNSLDAKGMLSDSAHSLAIKVALLDEQGSQDTFALALLIRGFDDFFSRDVKGIRDAFGKKMHSMPELRSVNCFVTYRGLQESATIVSEIEDFWACVERKMKVTEKK